MKSLLLFVGLLYLHPIHGQENHPTPTIQNEAYQKAIKHDKTFVYLEVSGKQKTTKP
ncbi:hypothetical protein [Salmonirosea aquatica]|uniref:hypothetical protein n=1 Tax=Salmonirosea aquatica TaxID=2654236 RepID=UPI00357175EE